MTDIMCACMCVLVATGVVKCRRRALAGLAQVAGAVEAS